MENSTAPADEGFAPTDPGFGADASPEPEPAEPIEADAKVVEQEDDLESEGESPPPVEEDDDKKTNAFQGRIDKLTESFRDAERREAAALARAEKAETELASQPAPQEPTKTLEDFDYDEGKFRAYLHDQTVADAQNAAKEVVRDFQVNQRTESLRDKFAARETAFAESIDDYTKVTQEPTLRINQRMADELRANELGPEMFYYLGKHPEEASRINGLSGRESDREMWKLESTLRTEKAKAQSKKVSDAPPPPAKVKGAQPGFKPATTDPKSDKMSDAEWFAAEEKRLVKLRG